MDNHFSCISIKVQLLNGISGPMMNATVSAVSAAWFFFLFFAPSPFDKFEEKNIDVLSVDIVSFSMKCYPLHLC